MYLQITTKCNHHCAHCCYSCNKNGKHMTRNVWQQALRFAEKYDSEAIAIGGGEPTLHPDFFDILADCLFSFSRVWMATNGSRTKTMRRLARIIEREDWEENKERYIDLMTDDQLTVALSNDYFHDPIDEGIMRYWTKQADRKIPGFELRDVTKSLNGPIGVGRAAKTGSGWTTGCCCSDLQIIPSGKIKVCGCKKSPLIGDVWNGIEDKWIEYLGTEEYQDNCYFGN